MILHVVALGDLGNSVHIYVSDRDVLVLVLRSVPELSAERDIMMATEAKCHHVIKQYKSNQNNTNEHKTKQASIQTQQVDR